MPRSEKQRAKRDDELRSEKLVKPTRDERGHHECTHHRQQPRARADRGEAEHLRT